jgi:hypothetical protein
VTQRLNLRPGQSLLLEVAPREDGRWEFRLGLRVVIGRTSHVKVSDRLVVPTEEEALAKLATWCADRLAGIGLEEHSVGEQRERRERISRW